MLDENSAIFPVNKINKHVFESEFANVCTLIGVPIDLILYQSG